MEGFEPSSGLPLKKKKTLFWNLTLLLRLPASMARWGLWDEKHTRPHDGGLPHWSHPRDAQVAARQSARGPNGHLGAGGKKTRATITICCKKDRGQHPPKSDRVGNERGPGEEVGFPTDRRNIAEARCCHLVRKSSWWNSLSHERRDVRKPMKGRCWNTRV